MSVPSENTEQLLAGLQAAVETRTSVDNQDPSPVTIMRFSSHSSQQSTERKIPLPPPPLGPRVSELPAPPATPKPGK
jgi:hypothetical protein